MRSARPPLFASRQSIDGLLAGQPSRYALVCRANALQRLAEDSERFFPWPALVASLRADIARIRERMPA